MIRMKEQGRIQEEQEGAFALLNPGVLKFHRFWHEKSRIFSSIFAKKKFFLILIKFRRFWPNFWLALSNSGYALGNDGSDAYNFSRHRKFHDNSSPIHLFAFRWTGSGSEKVWIKYQERWTGVLCKSSRWITTILWALCVSVFQH